MGTLVKLIDRSENAARDWQLGTITFSAYCAIRDHVLHVIETCVLAGVSLDGDVGAWYEGMNMCHHKIQRIPRFLPRRRVA